MLLRTLRTLQALIFATSIAGYSTAGIVIDFEDVGVGLPVNGFYNGSDFAGGFASGPGYFFNDFVDFGGGFTGWQGWAYSNVMDMTTAGFTNQYAAYSASGNAFGFGAGNSKTYAVAFTGSEVGNNGSLMNFSGPRSPTSFEITNTTYTVLAVRDGNDGGFNFVQPFTDGDYLRLTITGYAGLNATGATTGSIDFDLVNYQGPGAIDDVIVDDWTTVDISSLGNYASLLFSLDSSVIDVFGPFQYLNPPAYFAVDNFQAIPEPSGLAIAGILGLGWMIRRRRENHIAAENRGSLKTIE